MYYKVETFQMRMNRRTFCVPLNINLAKCDTSNGFVIVVDHVLVKGLSGNYSYAAIYWAMRCINYFMIRH